MSPVELLTYYGLLGATLQIAGIVVCISNPQSHNGRLLAFAGSFIGTTFALILGAMVYGR